MAEGKSWISGWRIGPNIVGASLGFVLVGAGGCHIGGDCSCPAPINSTAFDLGCVPTEPPVVKATGPCSAEVSVAVPENSSYVVVTANGAGTCHVELTFANGAASSVDVAFGSAQISECCGGGEAFPPVAAVAADGSYYYPTVRDPTCHAGQDAAPSG
jgi:hypothetical protein